MTFETLGQNIPDRTAQSAEQALRKAAASGVYEGINDASKYLVLAAVALLATSVLPWKKILREVTR